MVASAGEGGTCRSAKNIHFIIQASVTKYHKLDSLQADSLPPESPRGEYTHMQMYFIYNQQIAIF